MDFATALFEWALDHPKIALATIAMLIVATLFVLNRNDSIPTKKKNLDFVRVNRNIIECKFPHQQEPSMTQALEFRAIPNQRLCRVFGIDNAFTTKSPGRRTELKNQARRLMNNAKWPELARQAAEILRHAIENQEIFEERDDLCRSVRLAPFVQELTFKVALKVLFDRDSSNVSGVAVSTERINELWMTSKSGPLSELPEFSREVELRAALLTVLPGCDLDTPAHNPLNLILPAYETMWRVVLLGFVDCQHHTFGCRDARANNEIFNPALVALEAFLADPNMTDEGKPNKDGEHPDRTGDKSFTAFDVAREALRLYPSIKSIYRESPPRPGIAGVFDTVWYMLGLTSRQVQVDVMAMHRLEDGVWKDSCGNSDDTSVPVQKFYPRRWLRQSTPEIARAYVPFGLDRFRCPAHLDYGNRMVALLIATLATGLRDHDIQSSHNDEFLVRPEALPQGRKDLEQWVVFRPLSGSQVLTSNSEQHSLPIQHAGDGQI